MSKIKIDKIKLQDLSKDEQRKINGGEANNENGTITVTVVSVVAIKTIADPTNGVTCYSKCECLTANPGHQDSCGLCTTKYRCE